MEPPLNLKNALEIELIKPCNIDLLKKKYGEAVNDLLKDDSFTVIGGKLISSTRFAEIIGIKDYYGLLGVKNDAELEIIIRRLSDYIKRDDVLRENKDLAEALGVLGDSNNRLLYDEKLKMYKDLFIQAVKLRSFRFLTLGGASEIGRSSYYVKVGEGNYFLLDMGVKLGGQGKLPYYYVLKELPRVKAVFISHAHLDHWGLLRELKAEGLRDYLGYPLPPIIASGETKRQIEIMLGDDVNKGKLSSSERNEILDSISVSVEGKIGSVSYRLLNSGHIRGSSMILLEADGDSLLYTGDINLEDNEITRSATPLADTVNTVITEATYVGHERKENYEDRRKKFIELVGKAVSERKKVL
ncbi:MAG: MBL fold metallo-hydrolase, partial [Nitrososphaeria archaeon]